MVRSGGMGAVPDLRGHMCAQLVHGWGRTAPTAARVLRVGSPGEVGDVVRGAGPRGVLVRGLGRSYCDASLPAQGDGCVAGSVLADRILSFDPDSGILRAEAGLSLREIVRLFLGRGFFTPVSPGTQFVTLGGMVAADIHGKGHHRDGCFGQHVTSLRVRVADGRIIDCSPTKERDLFRATIGGMGLTGHILEVAVRLRGGRALRRAVTRTPEMALPLSSVTVPRMAALGFS